MTSMKLTARIASLLTAILGAACLFGAYRGLSSLGAIADPSQLRDAKGFAWFWAFLGVVFLGIAVLSWRSTDPKQE